MITLILDNIRSTYNVGAILRTAEGFGVQEVLLSGYTPRVHDPNLLPYLRQKLDQQIHKTALGAEDLLKITSVENIVQKLSELKQQGWQLIGLENNLDRPTVSLRDIATLHLSNRIVLILGEEVHGINPDLHDLIDLFAEIPMQGQKESFNVSVAAGIALYALSN